MWVNIEISCKGSLQDLLNKIILLYQLDVMQTTYNLYEVFGLDHSLEKFCEDFLRNCDYPKQLKDDLTSSFVTLIQQQNKEAREQHDEGC